MQMLELTYDEVKKKKKQKEVRRGRACAEDCGGI